MTVQGASLREQLEENYDKIVAPTEAPPTAAPASEPAAATTAPVTEVKDTRTTEQRARDEAGKFVKTEKTEIKKDAAPGAPAKPTEKPVAPAAAPKFGIKRPDSWKKELWSIWDKLDAGEQLTPEERKQFLEYIPEREGQYVKGVSAYKAEAEHAKKLNEALTPYSDLMEEAGMEAPDFVSALAEAHRTLARGDPQSKLQFFAKLVQDYQIPLHQLLVQGADGKVYFNQQYFNQAQAPQAQQPDVRKMVNETMQQFMARKELQDFVNATDSAGEKLRPHYETLKPTMEGLLRSGLVHDLASAHDAALRLPQHRELFEQIESKTRTAEDEKRNREAQEAALRAKQKAVSPRTSSPTGAGASGDGKNLRGMLEEAYDTHVAGRI